MTTLIRNDTDFDLNFTVKDANGDAIVLTGASGGILFKMAASDSATLQMSGSCSIIDAAGGTCKYTVQSGDLDTAGIYNAELQITYNTGKIITATMDEIYIAADLP